VAKQQHNKRRRGGIGMPVGIAMLVGIVVLSTLGGALWLVFRDTTPHVLYKAYPIGTEGWSASWNQDSDTCGNYSTGSPLLSFKMDLENLPSAASISYAGYVANMGWKEAKAGAEILPNDLALQTQGLEAIKATLENAPGLNLEYRAHFPKSGWTEWLGDGILVGAPQSGEYMDAMQARLVVADSAVAMFDAKDGVHVDFSEIFFKVGSDRFNFDLPETSRNLARMYKFAQGSCDSLQMVVEGHSSSEGDAMVNQRLSEQRAMKVRDWLVSKGVNPVKLVATKGFGSSQPKVAEPAEGTVSAEELEKIRKQNRRIGVMIQRGCK